MHDTEDHDSVPSKASGPAANAAFRWVAVPFFGALVGLFLAGSILYRVWLAIVMLAVVGLIGSCTSRIPAVVAGSRTSVVDAILSDSGFGPDAAKRVADGIAFEARVLRLEDDSVVVTLDETADGAHLGNVEFSAERGGLGIIQPWYDRTSWSLRWDRTLRGRFSISKDEIERIARSWVPDLRAAGHLDGLPRAHVDEAVARAPRSSAGKGHNCTNAVHRGYLWGVVVDGLVALLLVLAFPGFFLQLGVAA